MPTVNKTYKTPCTTDRSSFHLYLPGDHWRSKKALGKFQRFKIHSKARPSPLKTALSNDALRHRLQRHLWVGAFGTFGRKHLIGGLHDLIQEQIVEDTITAWGVP